MLKMNFLKSTLLLSLVLVTSGCQMLTASNTDSDFESLKQLKGVEFPSTHAPKEAPEGLFETSYDNGKPELKTWIHNGCLDRYMKTYYENGNMESDVQLKNCKVNGFVRNYNENGRLDIEMNAIEGKLSGPFKTYYDTHSNNVHITGTFKNGDLEGTLTEFDESGKIITKAHIRDGEIYVEQ